MPANKHDPRLFGFITSGRLAARRTNLVGIPAVDSENPGNHDGSTNDDHPDCLQPLGPEHRTRRGEAEEDCYRPQALPPDAIPIDAMHLIMASDDV